MCPPAGTYTYPISFAIPGHAPPSLECNHGSIRWRIKATVHRPGTFSTRLAASRDIVVVACPTEEDTEDTENIIVERLWDYQLQYLISISGRMFHIGGSVPITFTFMPLAKVKIHRIAVYIEGEGLCDFFAHEPDPSQLTERIDYYTQFKRIARSEPPTRTILLMLHHKDRESPILPLESDCTDAFQQSPLYGVIDPGDDLSDTVSGLMGPGPWTFHQDLPLPSSCRNLHFTNKNKRSNMNIVHTLKCVLRVERGDDEVMDEKTGKRKHFDIVVQTPITILSVR
jgi:arrestin-related trafficking adapter 3/6